MFEGATITMPYKEFAALLEKVKKADEIIKSNSELRLTKKEYLKFVEQLKKENDPDIPSYEQWKKEILEFEKEVQNK